MKYFKYERNTQYQSEYLLTFPFLKHLQLIEPLFVTLTKPFSNKIGETSSEWLKWMCKLFEKSLHIQHGPPAKGMLRSKVKTIDRNRICSNHIKNDLEMGFVLFSSMNGLMKLILKMLILMPAIYLRFVFSNNWKLFEKYIHNFFGCLKLAAVFLSLWSVDTFKTFAAILNTGFRIFNQLHF